MRNATIRQLQIFTEAASAASFARAAEALHVTPAAISFQIKQLESACGFALFERLGRRVVLTGPGAILLGYAQTALRALLDAEQAMQEMKGLSRGRITLGIVSTAKYVMPHLLARFRAAYPGVEIDLHDGNRREIIQSLMAGGLELAITGQPPIDADLAADRIAEHPSVIIAGPELVGRGEPVSIEALADRPFIARETGSGTRELMDRLFSAAGVAPRIALISSSNETIKQAVMAGMGLALISRHAIGLELAMGLVRIVPVEGLPLRRAWFVAHRAAMPLLPVHRRLKEFLVTHGQTVIDDLERSYRSAAAIREAI